MGRETNREPRSDRRNHGEHLCRKRKGSETHVGQMINAKTCAVTHSMRRSTMKRVGVATFICLLVASDTRGGQQPLTPTDLAVSLVNAIVTYNLDGVMAFFADDATAFMPTASAASRLTGKPEIRRAFAALLQNAPASAPPRQVTPRDLVVQ